MGASQAIEAGLLDGVDLVATRVERHVLEKACFPPQREE